MEPERLDPRLALAGAFSKKVGRIANIPFGSTRSYEEQAAFLGRPNAVRAVAKKRTATSNLYYDPLSSALKTESCRLRRRLRSN